MQVLILGKTSVDVKIDPPLAPPDIKTTCSSAVVAVVVVSVVVVSVVVATVVVLWNKSILLEFLLTSFFTAAISLLVFLNSFLNFSKKTNSTFTVGVIGAPVLINNIQQLPANDGNSIRAVKLASNFPRRGWPYQQIADPIKQAGGEGLSVVYKRKVVRLVFPTRCSLQR